MTKFTSDNTHVLSASDDRKIKYWDLATEQETVSFHEHEVCSQGWCQKFLCWGSRKVQKLQFWKGGGSQNRAYVLQIVIKHQIHVCTFKCNLQKMEYN